MRSWEKKEEKDFIFRCTLTASSQQLIKIWHLSILMLFLYLCFLCLAPCRSLILKSFTICWKQQRAMPRRVRASSATSPDTSSASWASPGTPWRVTPPQNQHLDLLWLSHLFSPVLTDSGVPVEMAQLSSYDSGNPETPETDDSVDVSTQASIRTVHL